MGIENELSAADIQGADLAIFAADIAVQNRERFANLKIVEVAVRDAIRNPAALFSGLAE